MSWERRFAEMALSTSNTDARSSSPISICPALVPAEAVNVSKIRVTVSSMELAAAAGASSGPACPGVREAYPAVRGLGSTARTGLR